MRRTHAQHAVGPARTIPLPILLAEAWAAERARKNRTRHGVRVELKLCVTDRDFSPASAEATLLHIVRWCLKDCRAQRLTTDGSLFAITLKPESGESLDEAATQLLQRMRGLAASRECDVEAVIRQRATGKRWT